MTSHQLARKLLELPDLPVTHLEWHAGTNQWQEIGDVAECPGSARDEEREKFGQPHIHLGEYPMSTRNTKPKTCRTCGGFGKVNIAYGHTPWWVPCKCSKPVRVLKG